MVLSPGWEGWREVSNLRGGSLLGLTHHCASQTEPGAPASAQGEERGSGGQARPCREWAGSKNTFRLVCAITGPRALRTSGAGETGEPVERQDGGGTGRQRTKLRALGLFSGRPSKAAKCL